MVIRLIHGLLVLFRSVAPQRPIAGNAHTLVMTLCRSQGMMVQTACVCGTSCLTSTCSMVGSTNNGSTTENTLPSPGALWTSIVRRVAPPVSRRCTIPTLHRVAHPSVPGRPGRGSMARRGEVAAQRESPLPDHASRCLPQILPGARSP